MGGAREVRVNRRDLADVRVAEVPLPEPGPGEVLLRVESFAYTANTLTYALLGEQLYWRFFPAPEGWGIVPAWGYAVGAGARWFGYLPMATHLLVRPDREPGRGFVDVTAQRADLPKLYRGYARVGEPGPGDDLTALLRPLLMASFLLADMVAEERASGAAHVLVTSASSKTAMAAALLMAATPGRQWSLVGLTSPGRADWVAANGAYDRVVTYDDLGALPATGTVLVLDVAGDGALQAALVERLGGRLLRHLGVGLTHAGAQGGAGNAAMTTFFTADQRDRRIADLGRAEFERRHEEAWRTVAAAAGAWLRVEHRQGADAIVATHREALAGTIPADQGTILSW